MCTGEWVSGVLCVSVCDCPHVCCEVGVLMEWSCHILRTCGGWGLGLYYAKYRVAQLTLGPYPAWDLLRTTITGLACALKFRVAKKLSHKSHFTLIAPDVH